MAKKKNKQRRSQSAQRARQAPTESRTAETLTIAWMLSVLTALVCELGSVMANLLAGEGEMLRLLAGYFLFAALVIGAVSLGLAVAVFKTRMAPPPRGVTVFAVVVGGAPMVVAFLGWWQ